jgi:hypothetical protein
VMSIWFPRSVTVSRETITIRSAVRTKTIRIRNIVTVENVVVYRAGPQTDITLHDGKTVRIPSLDEGHEWFRAKVLALVDAATQPHSTHPSSSPH